MDLPIRRVENGGPDSRSAATANSSATQRRARKYLIRLAIEREFDLPNRYQIFPRSSSDRASTVESTKFITRLSNSLDFSVASHSPAAVRDFLRRIAPRDYFPPFFLLSYICSFSFFRKKKEKKIIVFTLFIVESWHSLTSKCQCCSLNRCAYIPIYIYIHIYEYTERG